jgi:hypothetical protein
VQDSNPTLVIFYNLDSGAYYSVTKEGDMSPTTFMNNKFHLPGDLVLAPKELFTASLKICLPLFNCFPEAKKLVLSPSPRYWLQKCCAEDSHISNFSSTTYESTMFDGLAAMCHTIKDFLFMSGISNFKVTNHFLIFAGTSSRTADPSSIAAVRDIWGPDLVHASLDCMDKLAAFVIDYAAGQRNSESIPQQYIDKVSPLRCPARFFRHCSSSHPAAS